jgi:hypothetical protein
MLSDVSQQALNHLVYQTLYLAHLGCPKLDHPHAMGFPYEDLTQFILSLDKATEEEKEYVKRVIREGLEQGTYLGSGVDSVGKVKYFMDSLLKFFDDNGEVDLQSFWFGKVVLNEIVDILGNHIIDKYDEVFRKLSEH